MFWHFVSIWVCRKAKGSPRCRQQAQQLSGGSTERWQTNKAIVSIMHSNTMFSHSLSLHFIILFLCFAQISSIWHQKFVDKQKQKYGYSFEYIILSSKSCITFRPYIYNDIRIIGHSVLFLCTISNPNSITHLQK